MTNTIFYILMFSIFASFSIGSINYFGINRTFMLMYKGVIEASLKTVDKNGLPVPPYFDRDALKENIEVYLDNNLHKYCDEYMVNYYYFDPIDKSYSTDEYVRAVKISLKAYVNGMFQYEKAREFYVNGISVNG